MPGSPRKRRGESPQTGAKPGATLRLWSARAAERRLRRVNQGTQGGIDGLRTHIARTRAEARLWATPRSAGLKARFPGLEVQGFHLKRFIDRKKARGAGLKAHFPGLEVRGFHRKRRPGLPPKSP